MAVPFWVKAVEKMFSPTSPPLSELVTSPLELQRPFLHQPHGSLITEYSPSGTLVVRRFSASTFNLADVIAVTTQIVIGAIGTSQVCADRESVVSERPNDNLQSCGLVQYVHFPHQVSDTDH